MVLQISITFLNGSFHGRGGGDQPEWPPSPLRLFQAMVARADPADGSHNAALNWLAGLQAPVVLAPPVEHGAPIRTAVPNNAMDLVARAWSQGSTGENANPATHKALKTIQPTYLRAQPAQQKVVYQWETDASAGQHIQAIAQLASRLVHVGWGVDLVAGHAELIAEAASDTLPKVRWVPRHGSTARAPNAGTLKALRSRHQQWLRRVVDGRVLNPPGAVLPTAFKTVSYKVAQDFDVPQVAAFSLLQTDASGFRVYRQTRGKELAGMLRHLTAEIARRKEREQAFIDQVVLGHGESKSMPPEVHQPVGLQRFAYLPLPSLEPRRRGGRADTVDLIRRCLIFVPGGGLDSEVDWLRKNLPGHELQPLDGKPDTMLSLLPASDNVVRRYLQPRVTWATVTPVVLPGRDDRKDSKTEKLIRKAIVQAGIPQSLASSALIDWRKAGFWPGSAHADRHIPPRHLRGFPRYHVQISWADASGNSLELPGPLAIGGGRFCGFGLMAGMY